MNDNPQNDEPKNPEYAVDQTGKLFKLVKEEPTDSFVAIVSIVYLLITLAFFFWQLFDIWFDYYSLARRVGYPDIDRLTTSSFKLVAYVFIGGGIGGITNGIRSFLFWHCDQFAFGRRFLWKYIISPWLGSTLGLFVYALLRGSIAVLGGDIATGEPGTTQGVSMFAIGALAGYGSRDVFIWLDAHVTRIFKVNPISNVIVPNLMGKTQEEAEAILKGAGLVIGEITKETQKDDTDNIMLDKVIKQSPVTESSIIKGGAVDITVAVTKQEDQN